MSTLLNKEKLPSRLIPYDVQCLEVAPLTVKQMMLMSRAVALDSFKPTIEAVNETLIGFDANKLTDGDFFYILAHQRINSMTSPLEANWTCGDIVMQEIEGLQRTFTKEEIENIVLSYEEADEEARNDMQDPDELLVQAVNCGHHNSVVVGMTDLSIMYLDPHYVLDAELDYPRIATLPEVILYNEDPDMVRIAQVARWVKEGDTLKDKIEVLQSQPDLVLFEKALRANIQIRHGISRLVKTNCSRCGSERYHNLELNASLFFEV